MLHHLHIRDFVIVEHLALDLDVGMTALTGETGAGKSILIDALGLVLGERADTGLIRQGCSRTEVSAAFEVAEHEAIVAWLRDNQLDVGDGDCVLRRVVPREGRSRAFVNGTPVPVQQLSALGDLLVDVHGQHEHQSLLRPAAQLELLDGFAGTRGAAAQVRDLQRRWREERARLENLRDVSRGRAERIDLLSFQVQELEDLATTNDEMRQLEEEHRRLANAENLLATCHQALEMLTDGEDVSARGLLERSSAELEALCRLDQRLESPTTLLREAVIQVHEAGDELRRYVSGVELDPGRLQSVEQRIGLLHDLGRKHRVEPHELQERLDTLRAELESLQNSDVELGELEEAIDGTEKQYVEEAGQLSRQRHAAAAALSRDVTAAMQDLAMEGGEFSVQVDTDAEADPAPNGLDRVTFLVSANPGQALQPLNRVASGGELSRIGLAIQVITADSAPVPTLIFDEVDSGIGGGTAEIVGRLLRRLGDCRQVLCVTHLPQVAARAHNQLGVEKRSNDGATVAEILSLEGEGRVEELARMVGGKAITSKTLAHAREMIEQAQGT